MSILAICGSTRADSANRRLLQYLQGRLAGRKDLALFEGLAALPHFNPDLEAAGLLPAPVAQFRQLCERAEAIVICTPEYVFSLPGSLKNALEWLVSTTILQDKPMALITASALGEKAHESLRLVVRTMGGQVPEAAQLLLSGARSKIGPDGTVSDSATVAQLDRQLEALLGMLR